MKTVLASAAVMRTNAMIANSIATRQRKKVKTARSPCTPRPRASRRQIDPAPPPASASPKDDFASSVANQGLFSFSLINFPKYPDTKTVMRPGVHHQGQDTIANKHQRC